jgi:ABC-type transport system substrate-binding protein
MKKMRRLLAMILALAMAFSLVACGSKDATTGDDASASASQTTDSDANQTGTDDTQADAPVYGGSLTMYWGEIENYYDPAMMTGYGYSSFYLEPLWTIDLSSDNEYDGSYVTYDQLIGQIADTWSWDEDSGVMTVTIRDDIYFQDKEPINGRQLVAEDVKYSYDRLLGTGSGWDTPLETEYNWQSNLYMIDSITTDGDYTVLFQFGDDYHNEIAMNDFMICFVNITSHEWDECPQTWEYAYGTGPYILTGTEIGTTLEFTRNDNYYDEDERYPGNKLPYLDSVTLVEIGDSSAILSQFISGQVEWLSRSSAILSAAEMKQLSDSMDASKYVTYEYAVGSPAGIMLRNDVEPFSDVRVREAIQMSIPIEEIHTGYYMNDYDLIIPGLFNPTLTDYQYTKTAEEESHFEYNPEKAKELLAEAGYPDGFEFDIVVCTVLQDVDLYLLVQSYLAQVGIVMNVVTVGDIMEMISVTTSATDNRPMASTYGGAEGVSVLGITLSSSGSNYGVRHNCQEFEDLIVEAQQATTMEARAEAAQKLDELYVTNHWLICLGGLRVYTEYVSSAIQGYQGTRITTNNWGGNVVAHVWKSAD